MFGFVLLLVLSKFVLYCNWLFFILLKLLFTLLSVMTKYISKIAILLYHIASITLLLHCRGHLQNSSCPEHPGSNLCLVRLGEFFLLLPVIWSYDWRHIFSKLRCRFLLANAELLFASFMCASLGIYAASRTLTTQITCLYIEAVREVQLWLDGKDALTIVETVSGSSFSGP